RVERQLRIERAFIAENHVRLGCGMLLARSPRLGAEVPAPGALTVTADLVRTDELHLGEVREEPSRQSTPRAAGRGRGEYDRHAGLGEKLGGIGQRSMDDLAGGVGLWPVTHERTPKLGELEHVHPHRPRGEALGRFPRQGRLAAAREPGYPDGPRR